MATGWIKGIKNRLIAAFVIETFFAVCLVGLGVIAMSQYNAESAALENLEIQLDNAAQIIVSNDGPRRAPLDRIKNLGNLSRLDLVAINNDGSVKSISNPGRGEPLQDFFIDQEVARGLQSDEFITNFGGLLFEQGSELDSQVAGIKLIDLDSREMERTFPNTKFAIYATQDVNSFDNRLYVFFLLSSLIALLLSAYWASKLAKKFTEPILEIEHATKQISLGELDTTVNAKGPIEIESLGSSVNKMAADLKRSKELDRQFLLSVSHDLRSPLTVIKGYAEALSEGAIEDPVATGKIINTHSVRLERLVKDVLDLARLEANQFSFHPQNFELSENVSNIVTDLQYLATKNSVELNYSSEITQVVNLDPDRFSQVVTNLVENAIKFTNSVVDVSIKVISDRVAIDVSDDGPGISEAEISKIFDRFYVSTKNPEQAGNSIGMGLAICKELAVAMEGDILVESKSGSGTKMSFMLPGY